jgi:hypothetical protein
VNKNLFKPLKQLKELLMKLKRKLMKLKKISSTLLEMKLLKSKRNLMPLILKSMNSKLISKLILPYTYDENMTITEILKSYEKIDEYYVKLLAFEQEAKKMPNYEDLFELKEDNISH